jgi:Uma2 family endonuclease
MTWLEAIQDKSLADLPYKIELNRQGQIIMSPARSKHSILQGRIARHLNALMPGGEAFPECPIETDDGTKAADVVWASAAKLTRNIDSLSWHEAPEITVEILSDSNTVEEMEFKRELYFQKGALEFWLCGESGMMKFYDPTGELAHSKLCPAFPLNVDK